MPLPLLNIVIWKHKLPKYLPDNTVSPYLSSCVHTHNHPPHILSHISTRSVELSLYLRCIGTTLVWPLSFYLHAHRLTDDPSHQLIVRFQPLVKPCEFTILPLSCPPPTLPPLFLVYVDSWTQSFSLISLISPSLSLVFLGSYRSLWCNCASLHHAAFPQFLHTGGLHFTQENSLPFWLSQLWMLAIIPHRHNIRPVEKGWGVACAHMSKKLED